MPLGTVLNVELKTWSRFFLIKSADNVSLYQERYFNRPNYIYNAFQLHSETARKEITIRKHREGLLLIAETKGLSDLITANQGKVKHGKYELTCSEHEFLNSCRGILYHPQFRNYTDEEILEDLKPHCQSLMKVRQYQKGGKNLGLIEATFQCHTRPPSINYGLEAIKVKPYTENVRQCNKCYRFNHGSKQCRGEETCPKCGNTGHPMEDCQNQTLCINCKSDKHIATDKECPRYTAEKQIREIMAEKYLPYGLAKKEYTLSNNMTQTFAQIMSSEPKEVQILKEENKQLKNTVESMKEEMELLREEIRSLKESLTKKKPKISVTNKETKNTQIESQNVAPTTTQTTEKNKTTPSSDKTSFQNKKGVKNTLFTQKGEYPHNAPLPSTFEEISEPESEEPMDYSCKGHLKRLATLDQEEGATYPDGPSPKHRSLVSK